ncbi:MAG: glucose-6-phosphate isomerase [Candidatus Hydrogenedentes bacterium]|nr:glucose-6-phosphate isomerase [Candidatus Hydrogenedentota bacterium]
MTGLGVNVSGARSAAIGAEHGITPSDLKRLTPRIVEAHAAMNRDRREGRVGFYDLYRDRDALRTIQRLALEMGKHGHENLVVLGIGGSALGISTLMTALTPPLYNLRSRDERSGRPRVFVIDNIDPYTIHHVLQQCPPEKTLFNVISKSGATGETLAQLMIVLERLEAALGKSRIAKHVVVTTGPSPKKGKTSPLEYIRKRYRLPSLEIPENVGGRFSVFSAVGLFPAAVAGLDIDALAAGCAAMARRCRTASLKENPAYLRAAIQYLACTNKRKSISVMMAYSDALSDVSDWYRQLWAESLGKRRVSPDGPEQHVGQTPVKALGVTDQHSQLQLYLEGPNDKTITVLEETRFRKDLRIPSIFPKSAGMAYLAGQSLGKLMDAERRATIDALREAKRPVMRITLPTVNAHTVAQLLYMLEMETAMAGQLFGVNAFDQPAVERIKVLTRRYMGAHL